MPSAHAHAAREATRVAARCRSTARRGRAVRTGARRRTERAPRPSASAGSTTATCRRGSRRSATAGGAWLRHGGRLRHAHRISSRNRLSSESSSARTSSRRTDSSRASARQRGRQLAGARGLDHESVAHRVERDAADRVERDQRRREAPSVVGAHEHVPRPIVHRVADRVVAAGGREPAVDEHDHARRQPLDLVQDVRADDHGAALRAELLEQRDEVQALHGIGAVQRLVEHEHVRIAHERGRDLRALAHALAELVDARGRRRRASRPTAARPPARSGRRRRGGRRRSARTGAR